MSARRLAIAAWIVAAIVGPGSCLVVLFLAAARA
jgi:hypothetical protein